MEWRQPGTDDPDFQKVKALAMQAAAQLKAALGEKGCVIVSVAIEDGEKIAYSVSSNGSSLSVIGLLEYTKRIVEKQKISGI
jgi:hypothetical protein